MLTVVMPNVDMLSAIMLSVFLLSVVLLSVVMLNVIMLSVIMLCVILLSVFLPIVVMLNVVTPFLVPCARFRTVCTSSSLLSHSQIRPVFFWSRSHNTFLVLFYGRNLRVSVIS
jgi:hypothetical protein